IRTPSPASPAMRMTRSSRATVRSHLLRLAWAASAAPDALEEDGCRMTRPRATLPSGSLLLSNERALVLRASIARRQGCRRYKHHYHSHKDCLYLDQELVWESKVCG